MIENLTAHSNEVPFSALLGANFQLRIPHFQRPFRWDKKKFVALEEDLDRLHEDGEDADVHFMGAIIDYKEPAALLSPQAIQIIDGQQRLTALFLHLLALIHSLAKHGDAENASNLLTQYVLLPHNLKAADDFNLKLVPSPLDRGSMDNVLAQIMSASGLPRAYPNHVYRPMAGGAAVTSTAIETRYRLAVAWADARFDMGGLELLSSLILMVLNRLTVVEIMVKDPLSGPVIFDRLNSKSEPLTIGELVKNDVFSRVPHHTAHKNLEATVWKPFFERFGDVRNKLFEGYFFPYGLVRDPSIKKADVYSQLQQEWNAAKLEPQQIVKRLEEFQPDYLEVTRDGEWSELDPSVRLGLQHFRAMGAPATSYSFLMRVTHETRHSRLAVGDAHDLLAVVESFLVRRAVCGHEPSGLHAVFKNLWGDLHTRDGSPIEQISAAIRSHATVKWPDDAEFRAAIATRPMYTARITKYLLGEWDRKHPGDHKPLSEATIEHCLPQSLQNKSCWTRHWSADEHKSVVHTLGNLTLLSSSCQAVGNSCWEGNGCKRETYIAKNGFVSTTAMALEYAQWTPREFEHRVNTMTEWALRRWEF